MGRRLYEKGGPAALRVGSTDIDSLVSELGFSTVYAFSDSLQGDLRLAWEHEFENDGTAVPMSFVTAPGSVFVSQTPSQSSNYGRIGLGLTKTMSDARSLSLQGNTLVGYDDYDEYSFEVRFRQRF
ncbi:autotransporter outer membrane beta-barrel domain-containing protein [Halopseudomonas pachastrellae]|nr:autotransporter outer membrane beta-barrel domain-containing protein [Halopseudomonas pachastrellae]